MVTTLPSPLDKTMGNPYSISDIAQRAASTPAPTPSVNANPYLQRNMQWIMPGNHVYNTPLPQDQEQAFRQWLMQNQVPFDPTAAVTDYDMRGFWQALQQQDPRAMTAVDPNDSRLHYPDYWKTPYHETFSAESQWADPAKAPKWNDKDQLVMPDGTVIFDDRKTSKKE